jgi:alpha-D-ribose 1-methylphosphonate 5-triphosphate synthase subunit PhnG
MTVMPPAPTEDRRRWMGVLARASAAEIAALLETLPPLPPPERLRAPETGLVMVRGRAGGDGAPFNLGEMTVTRCAVRLGDSVGHAYVAGRDKRQAELAALLDAALQDPDRRGMLMDGVIAPLAARQQAAREAEARKAAATRVDFFAMQTTR